MFNKAVMILEKLFPNTMKYLLTVYFETENRHHDYLFFCNLQYLQCNTQITYFAEDCHPFPGQ